MAQMIDDTDTMVRYQVAFSLGTMPGSKSAPLLSALAIRDGADPWMRIAILSSAIACTGELFDRLSADASFRDSKSGRLFLSDLVSQTGASERREDLAVILRALDGALAADPAVVPRDRAGPDEHGFRSGVGPTFGEGKSSGRVRSIRGVILSDARASANDDTKPASARVVAVRSLRYSSLADIEGPLVALLAPRQPPVVQAAAIETLARFDDGRVPTILFRNWPEMTPKLRATAAEALFTRPAWVVAFLDAVERGTIGRADVEPARLDLLKSYPDASVRSRVARLFGAQPRRQDVVAAYQGALRSNGDPVRGKDVFKSQCASCHRLEGIGQQVGADLSAVRDRGMDAVLLNILDPNREVMPQFISYLLVTTSGRVLTGMIAVETANSLTIRQPDGREETVLRLDIEELRSTGLSYMPEGLEKQIGVPAMADLLAYLNSIK